MTRVKYFNSQMTGAPSLANVAGNLIALLDACLVNGFGQQPASSISIANGVGTATLPGLMVVDVGMVLLFAGATDSYLALNGERKTLAASGATQVVFDAAGVPDGNVTGTVTVKYSPAGWIKPFSATNQAAYKSGNAQSSGAYLRVYDSYTTSAWVLGFETLTALDTGTGRFPLFAQQSVSVWPKSNNAAAKNWWIVANDKFLYFGVAPNSSYPTAYYIYGFGDMIPRRQGDPYRAVLFSNSVDAATQTVNVVNCPIGTVPVNNCLRYAPRSRTGLGSPVVLTPTWLDALVSGGFSGQGGRVFPNPADNGIIFSPILMLEGSGFRGELPGCYATPQNIQGGIVDGTVIDSVPDFERQMLYRQWVYSVGPVFGGLFFDLTGPWGN